MNIDSAISQLRNLSKLEIPAKTLNSLITLIASLEAMKKYGTQKVKLGFNADSKNAVNDIKKISAAVRKFAKEADKTENSRLAKQDSIVRQLTEELKLREKMVKSKNIDPNLSLSQGKSPSNIIAYNKEIESIQARILKLRNNSQLLSKKESGSITAIHAALKANAQLNLKINETKKTIILNEKKAKELLTKNSTAANQHVETAKDQRKQLEKLLTLHQDNSKIINETILNLEKKLQITKEQVKAEERMANINSKAILAEQKQFGTTTSKYDKERATLNQKIAKLGIEDNQITEKQKELLKLINEKEKKSLEINKLKYDVKIALAKQDVQSRNRAQSRINMLKKEIVKLESLQKTKQETLQYIIKEVTSQELARKKEQLSRKKTAETRKAEVEAVKQQTKLTNQMSKLEVNNASITKQKELLEQNITQIEKHQLKIAELKYNLGVAESKNDKEQVVSLNQQLTAETKLLAKQREMLISNRQTLGAHVRTAEQLKMNNAHAKSLAGSYLSMSKLAGRATFVLTAVASYKAWEIVRNGMTKFLTQATQVEDKFSKVSQLLKEQDRLLEGMATKEALSLGATYGQDNLDDVSKARYDIISAQIDVADSNKVLEQSMIGAVAGFTSLDKSSSTLITTLKALGVEASNSDDILDDIFTTIRLGKTTMEELEPRLGRTTNVAKQLGIEFKELGTIISLLSQSVKTDTALTTLRQLMINLADPSDEAIKIFQKYGLTMEDMNVRTQGFAKVVSNLINLTDKEKVSIASSRRGFEALATILNRTSDFQATYNEFLNNSGEAMDAFNQKTDTTTFKLKQLRASITELFSQIDTNKIFKVFIDLLNNMVQSIEDGNTVLNGLAAVLVVLTGKVLPKLNKNLSITAIKTKVATKGFVGMGKSVGKLGLQLGKFILQAYVMYGILNELTRTNPFEDMASSKTNNSLDNLAKKLKTLSQSTDDVDMRSDMVESTLNTLREQGFDKLATSIESATNKTDAFKKAFDKINEAIATNEQLKLLSKTFDETSDKFQEITQYFGLLENFSEGIKNPFAFAGALLRGSTTAKSGFGAENVSGIATKVYGYLEDIEQLPIDILNATTIEQIEQYNEELKEKTGLNRFGNNIRDYEEGKYDNFDDFKQDLLDGLNVFTRAQMQMSLDQLDELLTKGIPAHWKTLKQRLESELTEGELYTAKLDNKSAIGLQRIANNLVSEGRVDESFMYEPLSESGRQAAYNVQAILKHIIDVTTKQIDESIKPVDDVKEGLEPDIKELLEKLQNEALKFNPEASPLEQNITNLYSAIDKWKADQQILIDQLEYRYADKKDQIKLLRDELDGIVENRKLIAKMKEQQKRENNARQQVNDEYSKLKELDQYADLTEEAKLIKHRNKLIAEHRKIDESDVVTEQESYLLEAYTELIKSISQQLNNMGDSFKSFSDRVRAQQASPQINMGAISSKPSTMDILGFAFSKQQDPNQKLLQQRNVQIDAYESIKDDMKTFEEAGTTETSQEYKNLVEEAEKAKVAISKTNEQIDKNVENSAKRTYNQLKQALSEFVSTAMNMWNQYHQTRINNIQRELQISLDSLNKEQEARNEMINTTALTERQKQMQLEAVQKEYDKKREEEEKKAAIKTANIEYKMAVAGIMMNTAQAIMKAFASYPFYAALPLSMFLTKYGQMQLSEAQKARDISLQGFSEGGYTGDGQRHDVAGVVHKEEVVFEQPIVKGQEPEVLAIRRLLQSGMKASDLLMGYKLPKSSISSNQIGFASGGYSGKKIIEVDNSDMINILKKTFSNIKGFVFQELDNSKIYIAAEKGKRELGEF